MSELTNEIPFVIIGGGIAGVSCAESLAFLTPETKVILITASPLVKAVTNIVPLATTLTQFDVEEREASALTELNPSIKVLEDVVISVNPVKKLIETRKGNLIRYNKLCICTGAKPRLINDNNDRIIGIRDTESVENLSLKIEKSRRIIVVGNGGIATELVHQVEGVEIVWVIRDKHISATFVDPGAAEFFQDKLINKNSKSSECVNKKLKEVKRIKYTITEGNESKEGPALGPDWHNAFSMKGASVSSNFSDRVTVEYQCEVSNIFEPSDLTDAEKNSGDDWPIYAKLTNGKIVGCDIIISATGVEPNSKISGLENLQKAEDGGFSVNWKMETSEKDIYAAGDVCSACWNIAEHWFQMRLWTQAHQMGRYAAKTMFSSVNNEEFNQDFCFDLFTHVTNFFGYKVVLLGLYNGQKLDRDYEILLRMTKGLEYVKLVLRNGKMQGAVLIGETELEEMCENLILNQLDLSIYGNDLLDPNIDIEDYFD